MPTNELEDLITQAEAARLRNVSREAIYGLVARGKLNVVEIGGQKFVRRSEVENYTPEIGGRPPKDTTHQLNQAFRKAAGERPAGKRNGTKKGSKK